MTFHDKNVGQVLEELNSNEHFGLNTNKVNRKKRAQLFPKDNRRSKRAYAYYFAVWFNFNFRH